MYLNRKEIESMCHIVHLISFCEGCNWGKKPFTEKISRDLEKNITEFAINEIKKQKDKKNDNTK